MHEYLLKFLLLGAPQADKSSLMNRLLGYRKEEPLIQMDEYTWFMNDKLIKGIVQDLNGLEIMSSLIVPYVKDTAVFLICYDPDQEQTIDFIEDWLKEFFRYIPYSSQVYIVSLKKGRLSKRIMDLRQIYFCCKHTSVDITDEKAVEKLFERSGKNVLLYSKEKNLEKLPGLRIEKQTFKRFCFNFKFW